MNLDWTILHFIRDVMHTHIGDALLTQLSIMGDKGLLWIIIGLVLLCMKDYRKAGVCMLIAILAAWLIGDGLIKELIARPRPFQVEEMKSLLIPMPTDFSFPSGHSSSSAAAATVLWRTKNRALGILGVVLAGLMMFSRMYCYVHFPSDILAGALLGIVVALIVDGIGKRLGRKEKNKE